MRSSVNRETGTDFESACMRILREHPEAIGVAYKGLDCGCALLCGVSAKAQPLGPLQRVPGQPGPEKKKRPICLKCKMDDGLRDRVVREGIFWPGSAGEKPDLELRNHIGRQVFGPNYREEA